jgi:hypothetical protein
MLAKLLKTAHVRALRAKVHRGVGTPVRRSKIFSKHCQRLSDTNAVLRFNASLLDCFWLSISH